MNQLNFFKEQKIKTSPLIKNVKNSLFQKLVLCSFLVLSILHVRSQTAPNISYVTPQNYLLSTAITNLAPTNSGGSIPALTYKQVSTFAGTTTGFLDGTGTAAKMDGPLGMTFDASGNIYFIDGVNYRIRKMDSQGVVTTIAGDGYSFLFYGRLKNNALGSLSSFNYPADLAFDAVNNCLYVTDKENDVIRKVSLTSPYAVTTFAGSGTSTSTDGIGAAATFKKPSGIVIDPSGTYLYVTDRAGNKIRRITISTAQVTTIAGSGTQSTVNNSTGTLATFNDPTGIAVDANYIYVTDFGGHKIRKISKTSPYSVTTLAGSGASGFADDPSGALATFNNPYGIALDPAGNLFVAEWGNKIRKISPAGAVTTFAGSGVASSIDANGVSATFNNPSNILIDPSSGFAYISEYTGDQIRKLNLTGYAIDPTPALPTDLHFNVTPGQISGTPSARNNGPVSYTITGYNFYGSSTTSVAITTGVLPALGVPSVSAITTTTATAQALANDNGISTLYTIEGGGAPTPLIEKGLCWSTSPNPTILDSKVANSNLMTGMFTNNLTGLTPGTLYYVRAYATTGLGTGYGNQVSFTTLIAPPAINYTTPNQFIVNTSITALQVTNTGGTVSGLSGGNVSTFAGSGSQGDLNGIGTAASFDTPTAVAIDTSGNLYIADSNNYGIRKITPAGVTSYFAGYNGPGHLDGPGNTAIFESPNGVAVDLSGNVYVADNNTIRKITPAGVVSSLAGNAGSGSTDGQGYGASFNSPTGLAVDMSGNVYVADSGNNKIRKITPAGVVSTFAGSGNWGASDGIGNSATFDTPSGLAFDSSGNLYVSDMYNNRIRMITTPAAEVSTLSGNGAYNSTDGLINSASFASPTGIAVDMSGNVYVAQPYFQNIRKISMGVVSTLAGNGNSGSLDTVGAAATFNSPSGVAVDVAGNIYVADRYNNKIRKIVTSTIGFSITPNLPAGLVLNGDGSISGTPTIASPPTNYTVTATNTGGTITTTINMSVVTIPQLSTTTATSIAATTAVTGGTIISNGYTNIIAQGVCWSTSPSPTIADSIITDTSGTTTFTSNLSNLLPYTLYYARAYATNSIGTGYGNQITFRTLSLVPLISTVAATTITATTAVSGGTITYAGITSVTANGVCWSTSPNPTIADNSTNDTLGTTFTSTLSNLLPSTIYYIRAYATNSAGTGYGTQVSFTTKMLPPVISYSNPNNLLINTSITPLSITNTGGIIDNSLSVVTTFAGSGSQGAIDATGLSASFKNPSEIVVAPDGNFYVADSGNNKIRKITPAGVVSTFAGSGIVGSTDGIGIQASFSGPKSVKLDAYGNLYVADAGNNKIRKITPEGVVTTLAGSGIVGSTDGIGSQASFNFPNGLALDMAGNVYVADQSNYKIRKITPAGVVSTFAGSGSAGSIDGTGTAARFYYPQNLVVDVTNNIYVTELSSKIRKITPAGVVTTFAGNAYWGSTDGQGTAASFIYPEGITIDTSGNLYITDYGNHNIRKSTPTAVVTTLAGSGATGATDGIGSQASFRNPFGITIDTSGNLYVTDSNSNNIRKISQKCYSITPALPAGLTLNADGSISGTPTVLSPATDYTVTAINAGGSSSFTVNIAVVASITPPLVAATSQINATCNGGTNGSATVTPTGGTAPYTYSWSSFQTFSSSSIDGTSSIATGLGAGTYVCVVTDAASNSITKSFTITQPVALTAVISSVTNVACNAGSNGAASVTATGGTAPYTYSWSPSGGTNASATGLSAGAYSCTITDNNGCTVVKNITITQPSAITATTPVTNVACNGGSNGSASVTASGGTPPYTYSWFPSGGTNASATGLSAGAYSCTITDDNGCTVSKNITITQPSAITASTSVTNVSCNGNSDGLASVSASGGSASYTYSWSPSGGTNASATGLSAGAYSCTITDNNGCTVVKNITITQPAIATTLVTTESACSSYTWSVNNQTYTTSGTYSTTIDCTPYSLVLTITAPSVAGSISGATTVCSGTNTTTLTLSGNTGTIQWQSASTLTGTYTDISGATSATYVATNLSATTYYKAVVTNGICTSATTPAATITVTAPSVAGTISGATGVCSGINSATLTLSGYTGSIQWKSSSSIGGTYSTISGATSDTYTATNLTATTYYKVVVTNGVCTSATTLINTILVFSPSVAGSISGATTVCAGTNSTVLTLSGYTGSIRWQSSLNNSNFNNLGATSSTYTATNLHTTTYYRAVITSGTCTSATTDVTTITVTAPSVAGTISGDATVTSGSNSTDLTLSGNTGSIQWQSASTLTGIYTDISGATSSTYTATNLTATTYYRAVVTNGVCTSATTLAAIVTVAAPNVLSQTHSQTNVTCHGATDGSATVTASGGTAPYTYTWSPSGGTAATAIGLTAGTYVCTITDAASNSISNSFTITEPTVIAPVVTTASACDTYTWSVNGTTYTTSGTYTSVTGCNTEILNLTITPSTTNTTTTSACSSYTWSVNGTTYTSSGTYTTTVGCATYSLVLTISAPSVAGTISGASSVSSGTNSTVLTLSGNTGTIQWQSSTALAGTYTDIVGATATTYTATNLTTTTYYRAVVTNGTCSLITSLPAAVTVNSVVSGSGNSVIPSQCGITLNLIDDQVYTALVANAQGYRWRITKMIGSIPSTNPSDVQLLDTGLRVFKFTQLTSYAFDTNYQVEVAVKLNTVWQPFGNNPCTVKTPATTTKVMDAQCGTTITLMTDVVYANLISYATGYRFKVTNLLTNNVQVVDRIVREFRFNLLSNISYNTTYKVEAAVKNTNGTYLPYGTSCNVTTPLFPTTSLQNSQCDYTATSATEVIYANLVANATNYRFSVTNTNIGYGYVFDTTLRSFVLNMVPSLLPATTYSVKVMVKIDGTWGPYGKICTLTTPGTSRTIVSKETVTLFDATAYPNPFAENFKLEVKTTSEEALQVKVYDMLGKLVENKILDASQIEYFEIGANYPTGVYNVIVSQGENLKTIRVIKR